MQRIKDLYLEYSKYKYPAMPDAYRSYPNCFKQSTSTNGLTKCVIAYICLNGWFAERISTTGRYINNRKICDTHIGFKQVVGSGKYIPGTGTKGSADISATINGISYKIEIKNEKTKDKQSKDQKIYEELTDLAGGKYLIVKNIRDFLDWYDSQNFPINTNKLLLWNTLKAI